MKLSIIFGERPRQWGFRGDPYFWDHLKGLAEDMDIISPEELEEWIKAEYLALSGKPLTDEYMDFAVIKQFAHGGMSSGGVDNTWWSEEGIPLLKSRLKELLPGPVRSGERTKVKRANAEDAGALAAMAAQMWKDHSPEDMAEEFYELVTSDEAACFIKYADDKPIGFAQCQLRHDYVEGTESSPVGYLEGIFITEGYRKRGFAAELLSECEKWAREKGCREFASDCELDNEESISFHSAMGFEEANRIICFKKEL